MSEQAKVTVVIDLLSLVLVAAAAITVWGWFHGLAVAAAIRLLKPPVSA